jgi:site-specific DNA-methyltransferase (adenine-specific)
MRKEIGKQTIVKNDCLAEMAQMPAESVDVVVTSPPYNIRKYRTPDKAYNSYSDDLPHDEYIKWMGAICVEVARILKPEGSFFLNISSTCTEPFIAMDVCYEARKSFVLQNNIVWVKAISIFDEGWKSYGHFKPTVSGRFLNQTHESIFHFTKTGEVKISRVAIGVPYEHKSNIDRWKHERSKNQGKGDKRCRGNCWHIPYDTVHGRKPHSAAFPVKLPEYCILLHGLRPDLVVLDPFLGSGTTLLACKNLDVMGIGIEIDEDYCKLAEENLLL